MFLKVAYNIALEEGEGKMSQEKTPKKILFICIMLCLAVIGMNYLWSCTFGTDRLPTGKNSGDDKVNGIVQKSHSMVKEKENTKDEMRLLSNEYRSQDSDIMADIKNLEQPAELTSQNEKILVKSQFVVSYNMEKLCPNYVCWSLTPERLNGKVQRSDKFHADFSILFSSLSICFLFFFPLQDSLIYLLIVSLEYLVILVFLLTLLTVIYFFFSFA